MKARDLLLSISLLSLLSVQAAYAQSDDEKKFEAGAHFSALNTGNDPFSFLEDRRTEPGVGGWFAYRFNKYAALEAEVNFFPRSYRRVVTFLSGGRITQGLFGVKLGARRERFEIFAKARPGFVSFSRVVRNVRFPDGNGTDPRDPFGFELGSVTHLALDVGGVAEFYPSRRTILRFDAGDTIVRYANNSTFNFMGQPALLATEYRHNLQISAGVGFRF